MPRKDRIAYNEYMKEYMRNRNKDKKKISTDDFNASLPTDIAVTPEQEEEKEELDLKNPMARDLVKLGKTIFKDPDTGKSDKFMEIVGTVVRYAPIVVKLIEGFAASQKAFNEQQAQNQQQENIPKPPYGWLNLTPLQRLNYKYTRPEWYAAGERYEQYINFGIVNPGINIHNVDSGYQASQSSRNIPVSNVAEPRSLAELSNKYPEPPLVKESEVKNEQIKEDNGKIVKNSEDIKAKNREYSENDKEVFKVNEKEKSTEYNSVVKALQEDNARYIKLAINYLQAMTLTEFKDKVKDIDELVKGMYPFFELLPVHTREMLKNTNKEEMEIIFKDNCKDKYDWLVSSKNKEKLLEIFEELKKKL